MIWKTITTCLVRRLFKARAGNEPKNGKERFILLNKRVWHALAFCQGLRRTSPPGRWQAGGFSLYVPAVEDKRAHQAASDLHHQWRPTLEKLGIRYRPPYNCRHTYATIRLMSGMNPAFIAQQLGHSVQMLLSTYARWLNSSGDWDEMEKLLNGPGLAQATKAHRVTP